jgi:vacuolar protein sorting-associated protein 45
MTLSLTHFGRLLRRIEREKEKTERMSTGTSGFNLFSLVSEYVDRMLPEDGTMKVLLVDKDTLGILSVAYSQSQLLKKGVFLVDDVENNMQRKPMMAMRCVAFIRPAAHLVRALCDEIRSSKYQNYTVIFSNAVSTDLLDQIARADLKDRVTRVEEFFCDFSVINNDAMVVPVRPNALSPSVISSFSRISEGLAATFVALRRKPHIRFQRNSMYAKRVASELSALTKVDPELFDYKSRDTVMIIIDRSEDPVTPLLTPWTYQAMLHELVGLDNNRLKLPDAASEEDGYVFSQKDDTFFASNQFSNWGDLCSSVKTYVDNCKSALNIDRSTATMEEIKQFMQKLPQTKHLTGSVTKHATVVSHLANEIKARALLDLSLLEQDMVSSSSQSDHWSRLCEAAKKLTTRPSDVLRLCLIFNLRYEKSGMMSRCEELLGFEQRSMLRKMREYYGERPTDYLFASTGVMSSIAKTFVDVGNIYTQHEPVLKKMLTSLAQGRLDAEQFPYVQLQPSPPQSFKPKDVIVFFCGGFTFAEAAVVNSFNQATTSTGGELRVLLGGTGIHSSQSFLAMLGSHP